MMDASPSETFMATRSLSILAACLTLGSARVDAQQHRTVPQYTIEQFMNTTAMFGASFAPDEASMLVTSDRSGVFNAWEIPAQGGAPRQITTSTTDGIFAIDFLPGERRFLYRQNRGGNENDHLYLRAADGTARDLTPGDSLKAVFYDWAGDDKSFFYGTNARDRRFFDVFEMPVATLTPHELFRRVRAERHLPRRPLARAHPRAHHAEQRDVPA
jgi:hypothetical protein